MPIYEYICEDCQHPFETLVQGSEQPECPECGGTKLAKQLSVFAVNKEQAPPPSPCQGCPSAGGPGGCGMMD